MDLPFNIGNMALGSGEQEQQKQQTPSVAKLENQKLHWATRKQRQQPQSLALEKAIDRMGQLSAEAQSLKRPVTSFERLADSTDEQALYLLWVVKNEQSAEINGVDPTTTTTTINGPAQSAVGAESSSTLLGYLKIVRDRRLYLVDDQGHRYVQTPICVLDFFVHDSVQHHGRGLELFSAMLKSEQTEAVKCAYDHPSTAFLQFLSHHFGLDQPVWQPTSFAVFPGFFFGLEPEGIGRRQLATDDEAKRPLTALERNRRSINQHYEGTPPSQQAGAPGGAAHSPRPAQHDEVGEIVHGTGLLPARHLAGPDTPQGRKITRDYGHQRIW